jgi:hypothetical protein
MAFCFGTNAPVKLTSFNHDTGFSRWRKVCERFPPASFFSGAIPVLI